MKRTGFTLIELLIVVAIIAILAAIAVPNFLEAQTRAKVSRVKSDLRSLGVAIESYYTDGNMYPYAWVFNKKPHQVGHWFLGVDYKDGSNQRWGYPLTTPISYITNIPMDPFTTMAFDSGGWGQQWPGIPVNASCLYAYGWRWDWPRDIYGGPKSSFPLIYNDIGFAMHSCGPDYTLDWPPQVYDPTNGTISRGQIWYLGKGVSFPANTAIEGQNPSS